MTAPSDPYIVVHSRDCPCGFPLGEMVEGCQVVTYTMTPPAAGGFGAAIGYIKGGAQE